MRILHVIMSLAPRYGGPQAVLPEMCRVLAARGHHVEVFTTDDSSRASTFDDLAGPGSNEEVTVRYFPVHRPRWYLTSFPLARALYERVREFDVVHIHGLYRFHTLAAAFFCRRFGVPYIVRPHGTLNPYHRGIRRWRKAIFDALVGWRNLNRASAVHYVSMSEQTFAEHAGVRAKGFVVPHGVGIPADASSGSAIATAFERYALVVFLGRLTAKKGLDLLCDSFACVAAAHADAHLAIAGPDDEGIGSLIHTRIDFLKLHGRVTLLGIVTGHDKDALLRQSAVFVLPSVDENFAVAAVEAMAAGVPIVITEGVAIHGEVTRADAGIVVERSADAIASAILSVLNDPLRAKRLGENGRRLASQAYSWERAAEQLEEMYRAAIGATPEREASTMAP